MMGFVAAAGTDIGQVRQGNEDSYWSGDSVFAVADGMGGHVAGEVASNAALEPIAALDGRVFPDAVGAVAALRDAVVRANRAVISLADAEPDLRGMGTTLTAAMLEGRRLHVAHVGDSRCYLLRGTTFGQITVDHTLVQHLIDEGEITEDEAASHPQRSVITRAIGVSGRVEVDTLTLDLEPGDQILLCSDGLTGPVDDAGIRKVLTTEDDADEAVQQLIRRANAAGGPDNITVVLLRAADPATAAPPAPSPTDTAELPPTPAAPHVIVTRSDPSGSSWAEKLSAFNDTGDPEDDRRGGITRGQRFGAAVIALVILLASAGIGGRWLLGRSYFVGVSQDHVAIFHGVPGSLGPIELYWLAERTPDNLEKFPAFYQQQLIDGIPAADLTDARRIVANAPRAEEDGGE